MSRVLITSVCLLLAMTASAEIYKSRDAQGRIIYSDRPQTGAEPVQLPTTNTTPATAIDERPPEKSAQKKGFQGYRLSIAQPANDSIIANGLAPQPVTLDIQPTLREGDTIRLRLDGKELSRGASTHFELSSLPRGKHTLQAEALDPEARVLGTSMVHTIFVYYPGSR